MLATPPVYKIFRRLGWAGVVFGGFWLGLGLLGVAAVTLIDSADVSLGAPLVGVGVGVVLFGLGIAALVSAGRARRRALAEQERAARLRSNGARALAQIVSDDGKAFHVRKGLAGELHYMFRYTARGTPDAGEPFKFEFRALRRNPLREGHQLWVVYDPADPAAAVPYEDLDEMPRV